jgi:amino acid adenylation domain-containing protein
MAKQTSPNVVQIEDTYVPLPERFEEIARRYAGLEAVRSSQSHCSFEELDQQSLRLARCLCRILGKEPRPVALLLEEKTQIITSLLGVIRAGHFYCALMHKDPVSRLVKVLRDLETPLLVTDRQSLELARQIAPPGCQLLLLSDLPESDGTSLPTALGPDTLLGVFYTSGSTGEPKGVLRTHSYVMHRLWVDIDEYGAGPGDRLLFMRRFDVTVSLSNLFHTLLTGATLVLYDANEVGIAPLADLIRSEQITIFSPPIEFLRHFLDTLDENVHFDSLRALLLSGEVLFRKDVERLRPHLLSKAKIAHFLSSSECGMLTRTILTPDSPIASDIIPVGYPVAGMDILILDQDGKPLLEGVPGQIVIRSKVAFPGYWGLPELSASKFLPDPMDPEQRVYCTGDLGYFQPDGQLVFLGRNDLRVKIRGFGVDCSSVEGALMTLPQVQRAVVVPVLDQAGHNRLVGCVVLPRDSALTASDIRTALFERLPDHMVPSRILLLPELPQTPNGKVDRPALQALASTWRENDAPCIIPANALEAKLVRIWEELLDVRPVGVRSDFFDLGGHSLLAVRMLDKVEQETGVRIPASTLLHTATIKALAQAIIADELSRLSEPLLALRSQGSKQPFYYLHGDYGGCGFYCREMARHLDVDRPFYVIPSHGLDSEPPETIEEMAAERLDALLAHQKEGPFLLGGYCHGGLIAFEMARQLQRRGLEVGLILVVDVAGITPLRRRLKKLFHGRDPLQGMRKAARKLLGARAMMALQDFETALDWGRWTTIPGWRTYRGAVGKSKHWIARLMKVSGLNGAKPRAHDQVVDRTSPEYREAYLHGVYHRAMRSYSPGKYRGKLVVLSSSFRNKRFLNDPSIGWDHVAAEVETQTIPGDHLTCLSEHAGALAETIQYYLRKADRLMEKCS